MHKLQGKNIHVYIHVQPYYYTVTDTGCVVHTQQRDLHQWVFQVVVCGESEEGRSIPAQHIGTQTVYTCTVIAVRILIPEN